MEVLKAKSVEQEKKIRDLSQDRPTRGEPTPGFYEPNLRLLQDVLKITTTQLQI